MSEGNSGYTRRRLIRTGAAGAVAAGLGTAGSAEARKRRRRPRKADVIVIGAGYAGLTAAYRLAQKGKSVIVLEARNRVGGRTFNHNLPGGKWSELGATFVGPTQDRVLSIMKEMHVHRIDTYDTGDNIYHAGGMNQRFTDNGPLGSITGSAPPDPIAAADIVKTVAQLDPMATSVPPDAPWTAQSAVEGDSETHYTWSKQTSTGSQRFMNLLQIAT